MANPYPAVFRDDNSDTRLAGSVDFTDPANQPGGAFGQSVLLGVTAPPDIHDGAGHAFAWDQMFDNIPNFGTITSIPAGMGLTFAFDGSDPTGTITTTDEGAWWFELIVGLPLDATASGYVALGFDTFNSGVFGPGVTGYRSGATGATVFYANTLKIPTGFQANAFAICQDAPTANPYVVQFANLSIIRVA